MELTLSASKISESLKTQKGLQPLRISFSSEAGMLTLSRYTIKRLHAWRWPYSKRPKQATRDPARHDIRQTPKAQ